MGHRAPPQHWDIHCWIVSGEVKVRNFITRVLGALNSSFIDVVFDQHRRERRTGNYRLAHDHVTPGDWHSVLPYANFDAMRMHGTIVTATNIILARPDQ